MHLITFSTGSQVRIGVLDQERNEVVDLSIAARDLPGNMLDFIAQGPVTQKKAQATLDADTGRISLDKIHILAPIPEPRRNVFCIGKNYREHVKELQSSSALLDNSG